MKSFKSQIILEDLQYDLFPEHNDLSKPLVNVFLCFWDEDGTKSVIRIKKCDVTRWHSTKYRSFTYTIGYPLFGERFTFLTTKHPENATSKCRTNSMEERNIVLISDENEAREFLFSEF